MTLVKARHIVLTGERTVLPARESAVAILCTDETVNSVDQPTSGNRADDTLREERLLRARIAELEVTLTALHASVDTRLDEAFERGGKAAHANFVQSESKRIATLRNSAEDALRTFGQHLGRLDRLANDIALTALERVLGDASAQASLVCATVRHRLSLLAEGSVLAIRVAAADFPNDSTLNQIRSALPATSPVELTADPLLPAGACLLDLRLGKIDAGIPLQHERLAAVLRECHPDG